MEIRITCIYEEIIKYYRDLDWKELIRDGLDFEACMSWGDEAAIAAGTAKCKSLGYPSEEELLFIQDEPYRKFDSEDQMEDDLITIRRYLSKYFLYLMRNVFYFDLKRIRKHGTYYINESDAPVFQKILLYSVSQHPRHQIIGRWLNGKIEDNSYHEIVELSDELAYLIQSTVGTADEVKKRWSEAFRIALHADLANTMDEAEFKIREIFRYSLPFKCDCSGLSTESLQPLSHSEIRQTILSELDFYDKKAQDSIFLAIISYLNSDNLESRLHTEAFPPVELLMIHSIGRASVLQFCKSKLGSVTLRVHEKVLNLRVRITQLA